MVHQHFMLVEPFTVLENLLLGAEGGVTLAGGAERARTEVAALERDYGLEVDPRRAGREPARGRAAAGRDLEGPVPWRPRPDPGRAHGRADAQEADHLFRILRNLKAQGRTIVLITHKLREIMAVTDQVSVMRAGAMVAHRKTAETSKEELAELMVGRKVLLRVEKGPARPREPVLEVQGLVVAGEQGVPRVKGISFQVRAGEILGIAGVAGNGQSELLDALAGIRQPLRGEILLRGAPITGGAQARQMRCAHVPEDRLRVGLVKGFTAWENAILGYQTEPDYAERGSSSWPRSSICAAAGCAATTCGPASRGSTRTPSPAATSRSWSWHVRWSTTPTCCWWASRRAASTSVPSSSSTSA